MQTHPFLPVLSEHKSEVFAAIKSFLDQEILSISDLKNSEFEKLHREIVNEYPNRMGKYFRPTLVLIMAKAMGFEYKKALLTAGAMQLSEEWILVHDDIEDESLVRRGKPTLQKMYSNALAINAGDALHVLMWKMLRANFDLLGQNKALRIQDEFFRMLPRVILGQTADIVQGQSEKCDLTEEDVNYIMDGKTGYYTVAGPLRLGAILACKEEDKIDSILSQINEFGVALGRAFQIIDDVLDVTSDFEGQKSQMGNDIYESKKTLIFVHMFLNCEEDEKEKLREIYNKKRAEKSVDEIEWVLKLMKENMSIEYARDKVEAYCNRANKILNDMEFIEKEEFREKLRDCVDFVATRKH